MTGELARQCLPDQIFAFEVVLGQQVEAPLASNLGADPPTLHHELAGSQRRVLGGIQGAPSIFLDRHEALHFRGFLGRRHLHLHAWGVFAGISTLKPVQGRALPSPCPGRQLM